MKRARILLVDDSVVVRRLVGDLLSADPALEVVGTAANGRIALTKIAQLQPDLVILDVEMPEMDGLATLRALREQGVRLPVLVFSIHTQRGAVATLEALARGASDYVPKPDSQCPGGLEQVGVVLLEKVKKLTGVTRPAGSSAGLASPLKGPVGRVEVVAIGASTGGPNALAELLPALPATLPVPVMIVQHMPALFIRLLAARFAKAGGLSVKEAQHDEVLLPGHVYFCPGDHHLEVRRNGKSAQAVLTQGPPENSCRPAVDVLFRSAAAAFGNGVLGVVLTGMGQDGLRGAENIRAAGGSVLAQDEASSVVWGMPGAVARAGLAASVLPLGHIAPEITSRVRYLRSASTMIQGTGERACP